MTLEFNDLEYRVRNTRTGNVVAAFLNSSDAKRYVQFVLTTPGYNHPMYDIETVNADDFDTTKVAA